MYSAIEKFNYFKPQQETSVVSFDDVKRLLLKDNEQSYKSRFTIKVGQHLKMIEVQMISNVFIVKTKLLIFILIQAEVIY